MKKSLIALAVASAFSAPSAFADTSNVDIYGHVNASFDVTDNGSTRTQQVSSNNSYIGLKGKEAVGGGTFAIWQVEAVIGVDSNSSNGPASSYLNRGQDGSANSWASGDSFVGLSGDSWGTVLLGRHDSPYKMANRDYDLFADTIADNRSLMGMTAGSIFNHNARLNNVAAYITPSLEGFKILAAYSAAAENAVAPTAATGNSKANAYSIAALYENKDLGLNLSAAYQQLKLGDTPETASDIGIGGNPFAENKTTAWSVGGSYAIAGFTVVAEYERLGSSGSYLGDGINQNDWTIGGKYAFTNSDAIKLAYTQKGNQGGNSPLFGNLSSDTGADMWSVGYDHNLSKRTTVYALYTRLSNDNNAAYALGYGGATSGYVSPAAYDSTSPTGVSVLGGKDLSAFSIGIKHSF